MKISEKIVNELEEVEWFINCGKIKSVDYDVSYAKGLSSLIKHIGSTRWENVKLEETNKLRLAAMKVGEQNFSEAWKRLMLDIQNDIMPQIEEKISNELKDAQMFDQKILISVKTNIRFIILAYTYQEYIEPKFAKCLLDVYKAGCIPCGWKGVYPQGKMIIF